MHSPPMSSEEARREISQQVRAINGLHQRAVSACWSKCIPRPRDGDLSVGEMACIDRCVPKFVETHQLVGKELKEHRGGRAVDFP